MGHIPGYLHDLAAEKLSSILGFANGEIFFTDTVQQSLHHYKIADFSSSTLDNNVNVADIVACQHYKSDEMLTLDIDRALNEVLLAGSIKTVICGNIQADMAPEVMALVEKDHKLLLFSGIITDNEVINDWRLISDLGTITGDSYLLLPDVTDHTAKRLLVMAQKNGDWHLATQVLPSAFIEPFEYNPTDHNEIWAEYLKLDRASAKLMWNGGAKSIGKFDEYLESISATLTTNPERYLAQIEQILMNLDPNNNQAVASRLTDIYRRWKSNS
jgi:hypothetical protein